MVASLKFWQLASGGSAFRLSGIPFGDIGGVDTMALLVDC
jgi:hypothetical protein